MGAAAAAATAMEGWGLVSGLLVLASAAVLVGAVFALRRTARRIEQALLRARTTAVAAPPAPPDDWLYVCPGETPRGPVGLTALRAMAADGRLAAEALAAPAGSNDWRPVARLLVDEPSVVITAR